MTLLSDALFKSISSVDSPTGIVGFVKTPAPSLPPADAPLVIALEDIQDPGNVGTLLRSAAAAGASHAILSEHCAFAWSPKVLRAAMGAHFALGIAEGVDLVAFVKGYRGMSIALSGAARLSLYDLDLKGPCVLIVGNEGTGLSAELESAARCKREDPDAWPDGIVERRSGWLVGAVRVRAAESDSEEKQLKPQMDTDEHR